MNILCSASPTYPIRIDGADGIHLTQPKLLLPVDPVGTTTFIFQVELCVWVEGLEKYMTQ